MSVDALDWLCSENTSKQTKVSRFVRIYMRVQREVMGVCAHRSRKLGVFILTAAFTALGDDKETWTKRIYPALDHTVTL